MAATTIRVRTTDESDAEAVQRVLLASYPQLMAEAYDADLLKRALPLITKPNRSLLRSGKYYVAQRTGEVVGCGGWSFEEPGGTAVEPGIAHIRHFAVDAKHVGQGVGRALVDRCEADARQLGIRLFKCFSSLNAAKFYVSLGFQLRDRIEVQMPAGVTFPSYLMEKQI